MKSIITIKLFKRIILFLRLFICIITEFKYFDQNFVYCLEVMIIYHVRNFYKDIIRCNIGK